MAEVAGLVIGAVSMVTLWNTCVQAFDVVASGKTYGYDYEVARVKLEVERIRLLAWGEAVGLASVQRETPDPSTIIDARLNREAMRDTVLRLLGCIQHVFNDTNALQRKYGLKQEVSSSSPATIEGITTSLQQSLVVGISSDTQQQHLILGSIFKRAYTSLQKSAKEYQDNTPFRRKTKWAISDKAKFLRLIAEIKGFNDSLVHLFPDVMSKTNNTLREDIDNSDEIRSLQLLQQASAEDHEEISETASERLNHLGATMASLLEDEQQKTETASAAPLPLVPEEGAGKEEGWETDEEEGGVPLEGGEVVPKDSKPAPRKETKLERDYKAVNAFCDEKQRGALSCSVHSTDWSSRWDASVYWQGSDYQWSRHFEDGYKGLVPSTHSAFDIYRAKKFITKSQNRDYDYPTDEDYVYLDCEANKKYDNIRPGTVTIEGYGMDCWEHEEVHGKSYDKTIFVSTSVLPNIPAKKLLRRIDELQKSVSSKTFGWNPKQEAEDLAEFAGPGNWYYDHYSNDRYMIFSSFYSLLNRRSLFIECHRTSSIAIAIHSESTGMWNFLWQVILGRELARRLERFPDASVSGFTLHILTTLIISDLWINNVKFVLVDSKETTAEEKKANEEKDKEEAEVMKEKGNEAMKKKDFEGAIEFYSMALELVPKSPVYLSNRAAAYISLKEYEEARKDAQQCVDADPSYSKGWGRLGLAKFELGDFQGSMEAYKKGIEADGKGGSAILKQGYENAKKKYEASKKETQVVVGKSEAGDGGKKEDEKKKEDESKPWDEAWDLKDKTLQIHSLVHEQQVEGLLRFAETMKWPFMNETRDFAEDVYGNLRGGTTIPPDLYDWIFGIVLPGKWTAYKIVAALVLCTPSLSKEIGTAKYYEMGLSLPKQTYWRSRTVLGRVLGCLPGVKFLCGWIGPCPPLTVDGHGPNLHRKYIRIKARSVAPPKQTDRTIRIGGPGPDDGPESIRIQDGEDIHHWMAEIKDESRWSIPEPPVRQLSTCTLEAIRLKKLPLDSSLVAKQSKMSAEEIEEEVQYRASMTFKIDNEPSVTYTLYTNPVFVTPPSCQGGPHKIHLRELPKFQRNVWNVEDLKAAEPVDYEDNGVMVINATGKGAETLARAWCSERGKSAIIRAHGGPCFSCAYHVASGKGLGINLLIWVSSSSDRFAY